MEQSLKQLIDFFDSIKKDDKPVAMLRYEQGTIRTEGCTGDFGCCSKQIDIEGILDDLRTLIEQPVP